MSTRGVAPLAVVLLLVACSADGQSTESTAASPTTTGTTGATAVASSLGSTSSSSSTISPDISSSTSTVVESLTPLIQSLVDRYDDAVQAILTDPRVAGDRGHPLVIAYLALFPPDSVFASGTLEFWVAEGEAGHFYRPGPRGEMYVTTIRSLEFQAETEVVVDVCTSTSVSVIDAEGNPIEAQGGVSGGRIVAIRVGDDWLLRDLTRTSAEDCPDPGGEP